jgi:hypothetical protein
MKRSNLAILTGGLIAAWFTFSLTASRLTWFQAKATEPPLPLLLSVVIPVSLFAAAYWGWSSFREFVLSLDPEMLTLVQAWRVVGFAFVVLVGYQILPTAFGLSAGWGDVAVGVTAVLAAKWLVTPARRGAFITWQLFGMSDLFTALALGAGPGILAMRGAAVPEGATMTPITVLPLSMIPTFFVPLFLIIHIVCILQARRWPRTAPGTMVQSRVGLAL